MLRARMLAEMESFMFAIEVGKTVLVKTVHVKGR